MPTKRSPLGCPVHPVTALTRRQVLQRALLFLSAICGLAPAAAVTAAKGSEEVHHRKTVDGMVVYLGVIPAEIVRGHVPEHPESRMHGGAPKGPQTQHVVIALFDNASGERISDAKLRASVGQIGMGSTTRDLEPMPVGGAITYGNYFPMSGRALYRIRVEIERPRAAHPAAVDFEYRNYAK